MSKLIMCFSPLYEIDNIVIEYNPLRTPPTVLRADGEPKLRLNKHDKVILQRFCSLLKSNDLAIEQYRVK